MTKPSRPLRSRTPIAPGETSIKSGTPAKTPSGTYRLYWTGVLPDGRTFRGENTGKTIVQVQQRAFRRWERELAKYHAGGSSQWSPRDGFAVWIEKYALPTVEERSDIRDSSKTSAKIALNHIISWARAHNHTLHTGTRPQHVAALVRHVGATSGPGAARHVKHAYARYVSRPLIVNGVIDSDPSSTVADPNPPSKTRDEDRDVLALSSDQYNQVLDYLLGEELSEKLEERRVPWLSPKTPSRLASVVKARALIDLALLQATTGLRVSEATQAKFSAMDVVQDGDSVTVTIFISASLSKTGKERTVTILDDRVARRLARKKVDATEAHFICGAPTDTLERWDSANLRKANRIFYDYLSGHLDIPELSVPEHLTHVWRATLSSMLYGVIPDDMRLEFFGHSSAVANNHYLTRKSKRDRQAAVMKDAMRGLNDGV